MPKLSQETLTILGASVALAALIFTGIAGLRTEMQAMRTEMRTEIRSVRTEIRDVRTEAQTNVEILRAEARADREALRAEARADREALRAELRADRERFERHILRLTEQQSALSAHVETIRRQHATAVPIRPPIP